MDRFLKEYPRQYETTVMIDTNCQEGRDRIVEKYPNDQVRVCCHENLTHPFHLTWMHRYHMQQYKDKYDVYMYVEDDLDIPLENLVNHLKNFQILWPQGVPVFFRAEEKNGMLYSTDAERPERIQHMDTIEGRQFVWGLTHPLPYHGCWVCPGEILRSIMPDNFARVSISRETAASFLIWEMKKMGYLQWEDGRIARKCIIYHLPNNYVNNPRCRMGKIPIDRVLISKR
jgi:hypothetical protein